MADSTHRIRLRGPWLCTPLARLLPDACGRWVPSDVPLPPSATVVMPGDWSGVLGADFTGVVSLTRRFSAPQGLAPSQRVWLVFDDVDALGEVALNGCPLGTIVSRTAPDAEGAWQRCPARFDVTPHLQFRNRLEVVIRCPIVGPDGFPWPRPGREQQAGGWIGLVYLEITGG